MGMVMSSPSPAAAQIACTQVLSVKYAPFSFGGFDSSNGLQSTPGGVVLTPGNFFQTSRAKLEFQTDGNIVMSIDGIPIWATFTQNQGATRFVLQSDGNAVVYRGDEVLYNANTSGNPRAQQISAVECGPIKFVGIGSQADGGVYASLPSNQLNDLGKRITLDNNGGLNLNI